MIISVLYSASLYYIPLQVYNLNANHYNGFSGNFWDSSLATFYSIIICGLLIIMEDLHLQTRFSIFILILNLLFNVLPFVLYEELKIGSMSSGIVRDSVKCPLFWLVIICTCSITLCPFYIWRRLDYFFSDRIVNNLKMNNTKNDFKIKQIQVQLDQISKYNRSIAKFKRVYNLKNFEANNYADKKMKEIVDYFKVNKSSKRNLK